MSEDEQAKELWILTQEEKALARTVACYQSKADRYQDKLRYIADSLACYLGPNKSISSTPDFKEYPTAEELRAVFEGMSVAEKRLSVVKQRRSQF